MIKFIVIWSVCNGIGVDPCFNGYHDEVKIVGTKAEAIEQVRLHQGKGSVFVYEAKELTTTVKMKIVEKKVSEIESIEIK